MNCDCLICYVEWYTPSYYLVSYSYSTVSRIETQFIVSQNQNLLFASYSCEQLTPITRSTFPSLRIVVSYSYHKINLRFAFLFFIPNNLFSSIWKWKLDGNRTTKQVDQYHCKQHNYTIQYIILTFRKTLDSIRSHTFTLAQRGWNLPVRHIRTIGMNEATIRSISTVLVEVLCYCIRQCTVYIVVVMYPVLLCLL